jgi:hypothetical protein
MTGERGTLDRFVRFRASLQGANIGPGARTVASGGFQFAQNASTIPPANKPEGNQP